MTELFKEIPIAVYQQLVYVVETGRWPDGERLLQEQRDACMQAMMLYQAHHNDDAQHLSIAQGGEICLKSKQELLAAFTTDMHEIIRVAVD